MRFLDSEAGRDVGDVLIATATNLTVVDDVFDDEEWPKLLDRVTKWGFTYGWHSRHGEFFAHWNHKVLSGGRNNTEDLEHEFAELDAEDKIVRDAWLALKPQLFEGVSTRLLRCYANQHTYGVEGYPHTDSKRDDELTVICYIVPEWRPEWAGETVFIVNGDIAASVLPKPRRIVVFPGTMIHAARAVTRVCPVARTSLMFKAGLY